MTLIMPSSPPKRVASAARKPPIHRCRLATPRNVGSPRVRLSPKFGQCAPQMARRKMLQQWATEIPVSPRFPVSCSSLKKRSFYRSFPFLHGNKISHLSARFFGQAYTGYLIPKLPVLSYRARRLPSVLGRERRLFQSRIDPQLLLLCRKIVPNLPG